MSVQVWVFEPDHDRRLSDQENVLVISYLKIRKIISQLREAILQLCPACEIKQNTQAHRRRHITLQLCVKLGDHKEQNNDLNCLTVVAYSVSGR